MEGLLNKPHLCRMVARNSPELKEILHQVMLDIANEDNRDKVGPTVLAIKNILDTFALFEAKGRVILAEEERRNRTEQKHA